MVNRKLTVVGFLFLLLTTWLAVENAIGKLWSDAAHGNALLTLGSFLLVVLLPVGMGVIVGWIWEHRDWVH